jgi:hypothetical protein
MRCKSFVTAASSFFTVAIALTCFDSIALAARVTATTSINLIDGPNSQTSEGINPIAISSASGGGGNAIASSGPEFVLRAQSESENSSFIAGASATAGFSSFYNLNGVPNDVLVPLTFNFDLQGSINLSVDQSFLASSAVGNFRYQIIDSTSNIGGAVSIGWQSRQLPIVLESGSFGEGRVGARITPVINIQGTTTVNGERLRAEDFQNLGETLEERILLQRIGDSLSKDIPLSDLSQTFGFLDGALVSALLTVGLPRLGISRGDLIGADIDLGFETDVIFDTRLKLTREVRGGGFIIANLVTGAASSPFSSKANVNFGSTLRLAGITVPDSFNDFDVSNLSVAFDSGQVVSVNRESDSVPIPTPALLPGLIGFGLGILKKQKQQLRETTEMEVRV